MRRRSIRIPLHLIPLLALACAGGPVAQGPGGTSTLAPASGREAASGPAVAGIPELPPPLPITAEEYAARRRALAERIEDGVFVAFGAPVPAADYLPYRQTSNFRYLTGIEEPGAAFVMVKTGGRVEEFLFVLPRDPAREVWEGVRLGPEGARARTGIPAQTSDRAVPVIDSLLRQHRTLYTLTLPPRETGVGENLEYEQQVLARLAAAHPEVRIRPVADLLLQIRARKSPAELDRIRRAVHISAHAHREAMRAAAPGMNEFEIRALFEYEFLRNGAEGPAYASIVGSGPNSTTLHYSAANRFMADGELLLMDVGASYDGYAADITRTVPVNGRFTPEQRAIYEIVLAAHEAAASRIRQGATWRDLNDAANAAIAQGLARLGLIDAPDATYDCAPGRRCPQYRLFYMHGLGHGVGLDVHDPDISNFAGFQPGSAVTVEPGIYVRADALDHLPDTPENRAMIQRLRPAVEKYRNIGVRIEDVYIFSESGVERASAGVPRDIDEIEALMAQPSPVAPSRQGHVVEWFRAIQR